ncbi:Aste57867_18242 [Aphanomyces stellatus]|uniref:Aste57867_18242 protein n=1 Tax=Aphanomyces stellatus TaxID=120398 RepID=A0A485LBA5_9STRA|nr:hypothetical protein As57867_018180 [Aphanomyces stellatus]VFT94979.1 Aste57867_18242 [Aphanomyces stellatus]
MGVTRAAAACILGRILQVAMAASYEQLVSQYQYPEDLILRNVHPFGVVLANPNALTEPPNGPDSAYCATGEHGALEYWERVRQEEGKVVFYYCKDRHISQWESPCVHLRPDPTDPAEAALRFPFPLSVEHFDLALIDESAVDTTPVDVDLVEPASSISAALDAFEALYLPPLFDFKGRLDHLPGVAFRPYLTAVPRELQKNAQAQTKDIDTTYASMLQDVVELELEIEKTVRADLEDDVPDPSLYTIRHFAADQRRAIAAAWDEFATLAVARGNATMGLNALRRALHWLPEHTPAYMHMASVLAAYNFLDDSCDCLAMLLKTVEPGHASYHTVQIQFRYPHCGKLIMDHSSVPTTILVGLQVFGVFMTLLSGGYLVWRSATLAATAQQGQAVGAPIDKKRKLSNKKKHQ